MNESNFEENENYQENFQSENSQSRNFQSRNFQSKNSLNENSQESTSKKSAGRPLAGVWHFFDKGVSVKDHCSRKCKVCGTFWARAKPVDLEEHLALDCSNQNRDVIDFYAQVVANRQSHSQAVSQETLPGSNLNKRKRTLTNSQTSLSEFIESTKLTSQLYRHKTSLEEILDQNSHLFNNKTGKIIKTYLKTRGFFDNVLDVSTVLKPIKDTITCLESKTANLADCYLGYLKLAIAIKNILQNHHLMFYQKYVSIFNERFYMFDYNEYLLAYYLHPQYRGAGIKQSQFARIAGIAGHLWTKMASSSAKKSDLEILKAQLRQYTCDEEPYNGSYESTIDTIKLFSVRPHAASCERVWSRCGWYLEDRHINLRTKNLESMVKISSYLISNTKQELHYYGLDLTEEEIQTVFQDIELFSEVNDEDDFDDFDNSTNYIDLEIEHQDLELENFIDLNNIEQDVNNFDEDQFDAEVEGLIYSTQ
ncbi:9155_t:CDS:2 [Dentiscutata heterogama]|uniref:9155_t:CDS:1 n=1 Tax=Dentiscutata heterogama TaxID=1316150 RepID=A0ACA9LJX4_9GLOM|nr:9155_t:CDS:2 [Dentiscutata heterogama]